MLKEKLISVFNEIGFEEYREIKSGDIVFAQHVFDECARNTCGNFERNHGCPPIAGSIEERKEKILKYENAFIVCKVLSLRRKEMENSAQALARVNKELRRALEGKDVLILGAGECTVCSECTAIEDNPCPFPEKIEYSMEGSGIDVMRMSLNLNLPYNAGRGNAGFFSLVLY